MLDCYCIFKIVASHQLAAEYLCDSLTQAVFHRMFQKCSHNPHLLLKYLCHTFVH
jgi:hypothetical protein